MSWSVSAVGKPVAVAEKLAKDFAKIQCQEPEETIKNHVAAAIAAGLSAFPPMLTVSVRASGSQSVNPHTCGTANQLSVTLEPLYGFVE